MSMAMFSSYFDTSGNKRSAAMTTVGFVSRVKKWDHFPSSRSLRSNTRGNVPVLSRSGWLYRPRLLTRCPCDSVGKGPCINRHSLRLRRNSASADRSTELWQQSLTGSTPMLSNVGLQDRQCCFAGLPRFFSCFQPFGTLHVVNGIRSFAIGLGGV
jgi:hypothetical protein